MLRVKSFKIGDADGVNELLNQYPLARGASVFVTEGELMVPFEDGTALPAAHRAYLLVEQKNDMILKRDLLLHSMNVLDKSDADLKAELAKLEAEEITPGTKEAYDRGAQIKKQKKSIEDKIAQNENTKLSDVHELKRLNDNIEVFDIQIKEILK